METAYRTEKELRQLMGENGLFYEPDGYQASEPASMTTPDAPGSIENDYDEATRGENKLI